jgi:hypothetical protein
MKLLSAVVVFVSASALFFLVKRLSIRKVKEIELDPRYAGWKERRRSERRSLSGTVGIYGHEAAMMPFNDEASVCNVSENGGLLLLSIPVVIGQQVLVINDATSEENIGRVVRVRINHEDKLEAAVELLNPAADFWRRV